MRNRASALTVAGTMAVIALVVGGCGGEKISRLVARPGGVYVGARPRTSLRRRLPDCTVYVAPRGQPVSSGQSERFPTTLFSALARVMPGSVVCLESGTYYAGSNIILSRSGTRSAPIYYRGYRGRALIQYVGGSLSGGLLQTAQGPNWSGAHDIVIDGLTLDGADLIGGGIFVTPGSHHITIENCEARNMGATGLALNATDYVTVVHNLIHHVGYNQGWSGGISLWYGGASPRYGGPTAWYDRAPGFHNVIADNIVSGTVDSSPHHSDGSGIIVDGSGSIPPVLIANNVSYENGAAGVEIYHNRGDIWVVNNTAYANGLDLRVGEGRASDFEAIVADDVHFVDDLAYGRKNRSGYPIAYIFKDIGRGVVWAGDAGYNGSTIGLSPSTMTNPSQYQYGDPRFLALPEVSAKEAPWERATPPWQLQKEFTLAQGSPAVHAGVNPLAVSGMTPALASGLRHYLP